MAKEKDLSTHQMREQCSSWQFCLPLALSSSPPDWHTVLWTSSHLLLSAMAQNPSVPKCDPSCFPGRPGFLYESLLQQLWPMQHLRVSWHRTSLSASVSIQQFQEEIAIYCSMPNQKLSCKTTVQVKTKVVSRAKSRAKQIQSWDIPQVKLDALILSGAAVNTLEASPGDFVDSLSPGLIFSWYAGWR